MYIGLKANDLLIVRDTATRFLPVILYLILFRQSHQTG